jgi:hypothetical protein
LSYGQRKCANDELLSYFQVEAPIHHPSFFLFFSLTIKDKTKISLTIKILHLGQGSFTRKVRTIFTLKITVSIFVKLFLILVLHLRQFFIVRIFVKRATGTSSSFVFLHLLHNISFGIFRRIKGDNLA